MSQYQTNSQYFQLFTDQNLLPTLYGLGDAVTEVTKIFKHKLSRTLSVVSGVLLMLLVTGCLPQDVPSVAEEEASVSYQDFEGIESAETVSATRVKVTWTPSSDPRVIAYNIYDATFKFQPKLIRTVSADLSEVTINGLAPQYLYSFRVRAADAENVEDENTSDMQAIPYGGILGSQVVDSTTAKVSFTPATEVDEVLVYCKTDNTDYELFATVKNVSLTEASLYDLEPGILYTCRAAVSLDGFTDNNTDTIQFTPLGQAYELIFAAQPGNTSAGANLSQTPTVHILDENGNLVAGGPDSTATISLTIAAASPTVGVLNGVFSAQAVAGVATFPGLSIYEAGSKIIEASKSDTSAEAFGTGPMTKNSNSFLITPGSASPIMSTITIDPQSPPAAALIANGSDQYTVNIKLADEYGNPIVGVRPSFTTNVAGDAVIPPSQNTDALGETTGYLSATVADNAPTIIREVSINSPGGLSTVTSLAPFSHGPANRLFFTTQPLTSPAGNSNLNTMRVSVQDAQGNVVTTGADATANVSLSINANVGGATLTGTSTVAAVNGTATFPGLGIDLTGVGYRLIASSGSLNTALSSSFNITAGIPQKIVVTGPVTTLSGACSTAVTIQLQDNGSNPANATANTPVTINGAGNAQFYSSSSCSGSPISSLTFTAGTNTRTVYMLDNYAESLNIVIQDTSSVVTAGPLSTYFSPKKIAMLAQAPAPAIPLTPLTVVAGACSDPITITPLGANDIPGPTFAPTSVTVSGLLGTSALLYSDAACTVALDPSNVILPINSGPGFAYSFYLKSDGVEDVTLNVTDPASNIDTVSTPQTVYVTPAGIGFSGPTTVVAGICTATPFTIELLDAIGNPATATTNTTLDIEGIINPAPGQFYLSAGCTGAGTNSTLTFPQGASSLQVWFKSDAAEIYNLSLSYPLGFMTNSPTIVMEVSPSAFKITPPIAGQSNTNECVGPFVIETLDGLAQVTNAVSAINGQLSGGGLSGFFYSDSTCETETDLFTVNSGENTVSFWFRGYYPDTGLSLTATDLGAVLNADSVSWDIIGKRGWLGTWAKQYDELGDLLWFRSDPKAVAARSDGLETINGLAFDPTYQYLYVIDEDNDRILKYDYINQEYIGWIGVLNYYGGIGVEGSNLSNPSPALCASTSNNEAVPGWCVGGESRVSGSAATGGLDDPETLVDDGTYIYVVNESYNAVNRYVSSTGAFAGYIGVISNNSGITAGPGGPGTCASVGTNVPTPGWCMGGTSSNSVPSWDVMDGNGLMVRPQDIAYDSTYIYVLTRSNVSRFDKASGAFAGWIGRIEATPASGAAGCNTASLGDITPGWCFGGSSRRNRNPVGGIDVATSLELLNGLLYVTHTNGRIVSYDANSGALDELLPNINENWIGSYGVTTDGTDLYYVDLNRVVKVDDTGLLQSWIGKVSSNSGMSGPLGCSTTAVNSNTPGWCLNGSARYGFDHGSFHTARAIVYDGNGKMIVGQGQNGSRLQRFDITTGQYLDTFSLESISPTRWTNDATAVTERFGYDDESMNNPSAMAVSLDGEYLFLAEYSASRVKKINIRTGEVIGWVGNITTTPTGGVIPGCLTANPFSASPGWCKGADYLPNTEFTNQNINLQSNGIMRSPLGVAVDANWVYVSDYDLDRISRYDLITGAPGGWIGRINTSPSSGAVGCNGALSGTFTPGWCEGGTSQGGVDDGHLNGPTELIVRNGNIYVNDHLNHRVSSYNATTGSFNGWIGAIDGSYPPTGGCTPINNGNSYDVADGWCIGGRSRQGNGWNRGGGFQFWSNRSGLTADPSGTYLYVANFYNRRVDKINMLTGAYVESIRTRDDIYTDTWESDPNVISSWTNGCSYPISLWTDGTYLYGINHQPCNRENDTLSAWKIDMATGNFIGWQGGIRSNDLPFGGDSGCNGATEKTPGWCRGGGASQGRRMGQFSGSTGFITGDANYVYVSDQTGNRVTRFPK